MGKKKNKRFDKKNALKFTLIHRSQQDLLYYDEEQGSKMVLHPADERTAKVMEEAQHGETETLAEETQGSHHNHQHHHLDQASKAQQHETGTAQLARLLASNKVAFVNTHHTKDSETEAMHQQRQDGGGVGNGGQTMLREAREVDELGLPLDGYDYSQHLAELGSGNFISSSGKVYGAVGVGIGVGVGEPHEEKGQKQAQQSYEVDSSDYALLSVSASDSSTSSLSSSSSSSLPSLPPPSSSSPGSAGDRRLTLSELQDASMASFAKTRTTTVEKPQQLRNPGFGQLESGINDEEQHVLASAQKQAPIGSVKKHDHIGDRQEDQEDRDRPEVFNKASHLPPSLLAPNGEMDRMLTAITTRLEDMDPDIRRLLEESSDENGNGHRQGQRQRQRQRHAARRRKIAGEKQVKRDLEKERQSGRSNDRGSTSNGGSTSNNTNVNTSANDADGGEEMHKLDFASVDETQGLKLDEGASKSEVEGEGEGKGKGKGNEDENEDEDEDEDEDEGESEKKETDEFDDSSTANEELDDDFMNQLLAAEATTPADDQEFDFNAHIKRLMEEAGDEMEDDEDFEISSGSDDEDEDEEENDEEEREEESSQQRPNDEQNDKRMNKETLATLLGGDSRRDSSKMHSPPVGTRESEQASGEGVLKNVSSLSSRRGKISETKPKLFQVSAKKSQQKKKIQGTADTLPKRDIDEHFDELLKEYEEEEVGELDDPEYDDRVAGNLDLDDERVVEVVTDYLADLSIQEKEKHTNILGVTNRDVESSAAALSEPVADVSNSSTNDQLEQQNHSQGENVAPHGHRFETISTQGRARFPNPQGYGKFERWNENKKKELDEQYEKPLAKHDIMPFVERQEKEEEAEKAKKAKAAESRSMHADGAKRNPLHEEENEGDEGEGDEGEGDEDEDEDERRTRLLKMWPGYEPKAKPKWDAETIISTYSTTDNLPSRIGAPKSLSEEAKQLKALSKTHPHEQAGTSAKFSSDNTNYEEDGMKEEDEEGERERGGEGEGEGEERDSDDAQFISTLTHETVARGKQETTEERRARKKAVKALKATRRAEKKGTRTDFKEEKKRIAKAAVEQPGGLVQGVSTFRVG